jgi:UDP-glucose 4-epimerase
MRFGLDSERIHLVTGGCGFFGSHLVDALVTAGCRVRVLDNLSNGRRQNLIQHQSNRSIEIIEGDVADLEVVRNAMEDVCVVFHLAALADIVPSIDHPDRYFNANVNGTVNAVRAAQESKVGKFIYAASSSCYGVPEEYPTPETAAISPQYPYALTKYIGEEIVLHWAQVYGLPAISLRFFNLYGPRVRTSGSYGAMFGVFLAQKLAGMPLTIVGDGTQTRDFTYVSDGVGALLAAASSNVSGECYNVGSGQTTSVNEITNLIGASQRAYIPKRPGEPDCSFADISRIQNDLGWSPLIGIEQGVSTMLSDLSHWTGCTCLDASNH